MSVFGGTDRFRANFKRIASANLVAQLLGVATLPLLSRLFTPEHFAVLTTYSVAQSVVLSVVTGRIDWILPNARSRRRALRLLGAGLLFTAALVAGLVGALILFDEQLGTALRLPAEEGVLWLLPIGVAAGGAQLMFQSWNVFLGDLTFVGRAKLLQALVTLGLSILFGVSAASALGLSLAYVAGIIAAVGLLVASARVGGELLSRSLGRTLRLVRLYAKHIGSSMTLGLVNVLMRASILMLLVYWYDAQTVGWYGLVFRVATAPIGLVSTALVQSFWTDAAVLVKSDPAQLRQFYLGSVGRLSILGIVVVTVALFGPVYIPPLFGREEWSGAGHLLAAVSPYLFGMVVFSPTTHLVVYLKAHWQVWCDVSTMVLSTVTFSLLAAQGAAAWVAILGTSLVLLLGYICRFALHLRANSLLLATRNRAAHI